MYHSISIGICSGRSWEILKFEGQCKWGCPYFWKASDNVFTATHALTNLSNVIPPPWTPGSRGAPAMICQHMRWWKAREFRPRILWLHTVLLLYELDKNRRKGVSKTAQGGRQFVRVNRARSITIKVAEHILPISDVFPQSCEFWQGGKGGKYT